MKTSEAEDVRFFDHVQKVLLYHQTLLRDEARNVLFYDALKRHVTNETRVLDIGAGSGVWAVAAAQLGAKKVTAIESDSAMISIIQAHARENGVAGKIEIIHGSSLEVNTRHKYEIILSETIGNQAFDENIIVTMIDARKRFLARDGVLIPQTIALAAAPAHLETETESPLGVPLKTGYINNLAVNLASKIADRNQLRILAEAVVLLEVDLRDIAEEPNFQNLIGRWNLKNVSEANVIALWAHSELTDGVRLDAWDTTSWLPTVCRFKSFAQKEGELEFNLNFNAKQHHWTVRLASAPEEKPRSYTPFFAFAKLKSDSQFSPRKRKPRKNPAAD